MIVPDMSLAEIKQSLMRDYQSDLRAKCNAIQISHKRKWAMNGNKNFIETILVPAKSKNNWRIIIECQKNNIHVVPYLIFADRVGICAVHFTITLTPMAFLHFNSHFFTRYKEREKLKEQKPEEVIKHFFKENRYMMPCTVETEDGKEQIFNPLHGGVGLGIYHKAEDIFQFKTYVDNSLLSDEQKKQIFDIHTETFQRLIDAFRDPNRKSKDFY